MRYKLSRFSRIGNFVVLRDGFFNELGMIEHNLDCMLSIYYEKKFLKRLKNNTSIKAVITTKELSNDLVDYHIAVSDNPMESYYKIHNYLLNNTSHFEPGIGFSIGKGCLISKNAQISSKNVKIGKNCVINDFVTIKENTVIGDNVKIDSGCQIGCNGFETKLIDGVQQIIPHAGGVIIGNDVELCSNCTVAKALGKSNTKIGHSTKIDTQVHIAHGSIVGESVRIASGATISGSVVIGNNVWIGPNSTISNGVKINDNANITIGSTVISDVAKNSKVTGYFSIDHREFIRQRYLLSKIRQKSI